ncbi:MAG: hypothetical protein J2P32_16455 [Actinobacteria bacterium]|nr:hypothetical protein [Actinomycetota bacterium]
MTYQPYPTPGGQLPEPPPRTEPPSSVRTAAMFMYAGAVLSAIGVVLTLLSLHSIETAIRNTQTSNRLTPSEIHAAAVGTVVVSVVISLIAIGLWIWMAWANKAGKNWARITATVLFGLNTLSVVAGFVRAGATLSRIAGLLIWLAGLAAIFLLWRRESTDYFEANRAS